MQYVPIMTPNPMVAPNRAKKSSLVRYYDDDNVRYDDDDVRDDDEDVRDDDARNDGDDYDNDYVEMMIMSIMIMIKIKMIKWW